VPGLLTRVRTRMTIPAHRRTRGLLDGGYASVFSGRSHDFDDLREYVPGDEIRDIDWKATARLGSPLVKRYAATRDQTVVLVVDTGRGMTARAAGGGSKCDVALLAAGVLASVATAHGDSVALVAADAATSVALPGRSSDAHLERLLRTIEARTTPDAAPSDLLALLAAASGAFRRRLLMIVVTDECALTAAHERALRRLAAQHEVLWIAVEDADPTDPTAGDLIDATSATVLPSAVRLSRGLRAEFDASVRARRESNTAVLHHVGITPGRLRDEDGVVGGLYSMLERHRRAR